MNCTIPKRGDFCSSFPSGVGKKQKNVVLAGKEPLRRTPERGVREGEFSNRRLSSKIKGAGKGMNGEGDRGGKTLNSLN